MLGRVRLASDSPSAVLKRWISALVCLFQAEIAALLRQRDKAVMERRWRWRSNVLEDERLEIASSVEIDLDARLAAVAAAAGDAEGGRRGPPAAPAGGGGGGESNQTAGQLKRGLTSSP